MKLRVKLPGDAIHGLPLRRPRLQTEIRLVPLERGRAIVEKLVGDDGAVQQRRSVVGSNPQSGLKLAVGLGVAPSLHPDQAQPVQASLRTRVDLERSVETPLGSVRLTRPKAGRAQLDPSGFRLRLKAGERSQGRDGSTPIRLVHVHATEVVLRGRQIVIQRQSALVGADSLGEAACAMVGQAEMIPCLRFLWEQARGLLELGDRRLGLALADEAFAFQQRPRARRCAANEQERRDGGQTEHTRSANLLFGSQHPVRW
jgi:hypothetical protein